MPQLYHIVSSCTKIFFPDPWMLAGNYTVTQVYCTIVRTTPYNLWLWDVCCQILSSSTFDTIRKCILLCCSAVTNGIMIHFLNCVNEQNYLPLHYLFLLFSVSICTLYALLPLLLMHLNPFIRLLFQGNHIMITNNSCSSHFFMIIVYLVAQ